MNNWNIPDWLEQEVRDRDKKCVYCNTEFSTSEKREPQPGSILLMMRK